LNAYVLLEWLIVGGAVAVSAWVAFGKFFPQLRRRLLGRFSPQPPPSSGGCGSGCDTCGSCGNNPANREAAAAKEQPLRFHR
jgi:hypothetical protein